MDYIYQDIGKFFKCVKIVFRNENNLKHVLFVSCRSILLL